MFDPFDHEDPDLTAAIRSAHRDLTNYKAESDEYRAALSQLNQLYRIRQEQFQLNLQAQREYAAHQLAGKQFDHQVELDVAQHQLALDQNEWQEEQDQRPFWRRVEPSTALTVAGNLAIALLVVKYEQRSVISTQVRHFMQRI